ncbi:MAG TPA: acetate--CoA ligase family protein, partial [Myxococcales bacterium]|nr:acetate--CoA ligase family protein [Myxococcales bacterium]
TQAEAVAAAIVDVAGRAKKPILSCFMGTHGVPESLRSLHTGHVPSFRFPEGAARALSLVSSYARWRQAPPARLLEAGPTPAAASQALGAARRRLGPPGGWLSAEEAEAFCRAWGLTLPAARLVAPTAAAVEDAAAALGYPVVLKAQREGLLHKSHEGGVAVGLAGPVALREAAARMAALAPEAFLVQKQIVGGEEWLAGVIRDRDYGPLVTAGAGGTRTEIWHDVEQRLAPLTQVDLDALLDRPRFARTLAGTAGGKPGDRAALAAFVRQLSFAALAHPEVEEMEANPLLVLPAGEGAVAVDVRLRIGAR